jgi:iron(II)-dependent oxidoreductase
VADLVGNVWQYTDIFEDTHTRAAVVRGSSNYYPDGSKWYFPPALELNKHNKYFLMDESYERAGTIGFRCVREAAP